MFYNSEIKDEYLADQISPSTRKMKSFFTGLIEPFETKKDKDLMYFTVEEMEEMLLTLSNGKEVKSFHRAYMSQYLTWAEKKGYIKKNLLKKTRGRVSVKDLPDPDKAIDRYFSRKEILRAIAGCVNAQDGAVIALAFEGIVGLDNTEIRYLRATDIDFDAATVTVRNVKEKDTPEGRVIDELLNTRTVSVTQETLDILRAAIAQVDFYHNNGDVVDDQRGFYHKLTENEFVIRNADLNIKSESSVIHSVTVQTRLDKVKKSLNLPTLVLGTIQRSGMIHMAKDLLLSEGELQKPQFLKICKRYNYSENIWFKLKDFCNIEVLKRMYPEAIESPN